LHVAAAIAAVVITGMAVLLAVVLRPLPVLGGQPEAADAKDAEVKAAGQ
jgi:DHA2 family multidrug resistance protein-like MFS transporter